MLIDNSDTASRSAVLIDRHHFLEMARKRHRIMATATKKSTKRASKKASNGKARSAAENKALEAGKMGRWRPIADGLSYKDQAFESWLKRPTETAAIKAEMVKKYPNGPSPSTWSKWLSGFANGRDGSNGDPNYPRSAGGRIKQILAALKKTGGKLNANEKKRVEKMTDRS